MKLKPRPDEARRGTWPGRGNARHPEATLRIYCPDGATLEELSVWVAEPRLHVAGLARKRALRVAIDQTVKLSAALDRQRQFELGFDSFRWSHSGKVHYRPEHLARDGKVFSWDSEVAKNDPPGFQPFCGCRAAAYLDPNEE